MIIQITATPIYAVDVKLPTVNPNSNANAVTIIPVVKQQHKAKFLDFFKVVAISILLGS